MNNQILQTLLKELDKDQPRLDYIRGILETLVSMAGEVPSSGTYTLKPTPKMENYGSTSALFPGMQTVVPPKDPDEGAILDAKVKGRVDSIREMAEKGLDMP